MILKYQSGRNELTNDKDETSERGIVTQQSKPDDFLRAKYEHMMGGLWTDRLPRFL